MQQLLLFPLARCCRIIPVTHPHQSVRPDIDPMRRLGTAKDEYVKIVSEADAVARGIDLKDRVAHLVLLDSGLLLLVFVVERSAQNALSPNHPSQRLFVRVAPRGEHGGQKRGANAVSIAVLGVFELLSQELDDRGSDRGFAHFFLAWG